MEFPIRWQNDGKEDTIKVRISYSETFVNVRESLEIPSAKALASVGMRYGFELDEIPEEEPINVINITEIELTTGSKELQDELQKAFAFEFALQCAETQCENAIESLIEIGGEMAKNFLNNGGHIRISDEMVLELKKLWESPQHH